MIKPRYYQEEAVDSLFTYFSQKEGNPLVAMPTASGKSVVIGSFAHQVCTRYRNQRILILTHVKELIEQNFEKLLTIWPAAPAGIFSAGLKRKESYFPVTVAGIASVWKSAALFGHIDLVLIDECHLLSPKDDTMYGKFLNQLKHVNPLVKVIGFTATPYRLGLGLMTQGTLFTDICYDLTSMDAFNRLVAEGFLCRLVPKRTGLQYDLSQVAVKGGEFVQQELQSAVDQKDLTRSAVAEICSLGQERKHWLIFASGVEHAEHVAEVLKLHGISVAVVHSKMTTELRDEQIAGFKSGKYRAMCNNQVLTTGFDFPGIDLIAMLRPTQSTGLWVQMLGRGTRPADGKTDCLVLDFCGNTRRLGPINDPVIPKKKGESKGGTAPVRLCDACKCYNHASATVCTFCGSEFPRQLKIKQEAATDEVMIFDTPDVRTLAVDRVVYSVHSKPGHPPSLQVAYYCGLNLYREWICLEHGGFAGKKAREWWRNRTNILPPQTVDVAVKYLSELRVATAIRVWLNKKYPEILSHIFNDTVAPQK